MAMFPFVNGSACRAETVNLMILNGCGEAHARNDFLDGFDNVVRERQFNNATASAADEKMGVFAGYV